MGAVPHPLPNTFDLLIPIGAPSGSAPPTPPPAQWLADAPIAAGWILATARITGTIRRD